ncbi:hypothetical protein Danklef1_39 [Polaribacter phage Danklef_1]|nr:HNH endonuclease [Polaribacter phage Danklef_1]QQV90598.1 hypothetical protein Danklef2_40 [Polaribacter phage Danklef_2]QQV90675.1 hypothetical protein Danklef3_41 [Polaribacter phage Danklef_3]QQV90751.1 hypothetical protein Danklef4_40 [Polaribacter phage Danklef_4]QQV90829.1 hypothetical protein Danklef5_41 [Polaribacter phage Danklef_5]QQV90520.1 hypothetical protein Danklef1_39 [Polaribacter phage Danklef_1]
MVVLKDLGIEKTKSGHKKRFVIAKCECGNDFKVALNSIKSGNTKSCGCGSHRKKPLTSYKLYWVLQNMKTRCYNQNREFYYLYGGRGVKICKTWLDDPMSFIQWSLDNGYKKGLYIDRINPNKNYSPKNCRYVDASLNAINTRLLQSNNNSGYRGVSKHVTKLGVIRWRSRISYKNKVISLGVYNTKQAAGLAYNNYIDLNNLEHPKNNIKK